MSGDSCPVRSNGSIEQEIDDIYDSMAHNVEQPAGTLLRLLRLDPDKGIVEIGHEYKLRFGGEYGEDSGYFSGGYVGGPNEGVVAPIYNAVGEVYPTLTPAQKTAALRQLFEILDRRNYVEVQNTHTPHIREPLLLADVCTVMPLYWPGMDAEKKKISGYVNFQELKHELIDTKGRFRPSEVGSDFIMAYALLRSDMSRFGEEYLMVAEPKFIGRVMQGIVQLRFKRGRGGESVETGTKRLEELLPRSQHQLIEPLRLSLDISHLAEFIR